MLLTAKIYSPSLGYLVSRIFEMPTNKEVVWSYARSVVALMADKIANRNCPTVKNPRRPVGYYCFLVGTIWAYRAITATTHPSGPLPTVTKFWTMFRDLSVLVYLTPKPFLKCLGKALLNKLGDGRFFLHLISYFDCLPRLRLFVQRAGTFVFCSVSSILATQDCFAADLVFTPSPSAFVTNYSVYYGPSPSRALTNRVDLGGATAWTITNVAPATNAFLFCTAWAGGQESDPSNEITYTNLHGTIALNLVLERAGDPAGPFLPVTNILTYTAAVEPNQFYRVRMDAIVSP